MILEVSDYYNIELYNLLDVENEHISGPSDHSDTESAVDANLDLQVYTYIINSSKSILGPANNGIDSNIDFL